MAIGQITSITENVKGLAYTGIMTGAASATSIIIADLVGFGNSNDVFNTDFVAVVLLNANSVSNAPEGEIRDITDYVTATGTFTTVAFSQNVEPGDVILLARRELFVIDGIALKTTPITNSLAYRLSQFLASGDGDWATGQPLPSNTSLVDLFGAFTGPVGGAAQDDNIKASLDLAHTDIDAILADTGTDGVVVNSLTVAGETAIEGAAEDALEGENLDHLLMLDGATNVYPEQCVADSILAKVIAKGDPATPSTYNCTTDSLEMLSDKMGTFSGDGGAAQDDSTKASLDLAHTEIAALPTDADVNAEVDAALNTIVPASPTAGSLNDILSKAAGGNTFVKTTDSLEAIGEDTDTILADTNELQTDWVDGGRLDLLVDAIKAKTDVIVAGGATEVNVDAVETKVDTVTTELAKVPKSDSTVSWNATALGAINAEVDTAFNTIVPASPTVGSINDILSKAAGANTFDKATDSLESLGEDSDAILADTNELQTDWTNGGRLDLLIDAILARTSYGTVIRKTVAFDGAAGNGAIGTVALFTVTGDVRVKVTAICSETLVGAATLECGVTGNTAGIIAQIIDATALIINEIWFDATPTTTLDDDSSIPRKVIAAGQDIILTVGSAAITDGTIKFVAEYEALSTDGAVVAI